MVVVELREVVRAGNAVDVVRIDEHEDAMTFRPGPVASMRSLSSETMMRPGSEPSTYAPYASDVASSQP